MTSEKVYSKEKWKKVNRLNKELLEDYMIELKSKRRRPRTIEQYRTDGHMLLCYIHDHMDNRCILEFSKKDFRKIALWLTEERNVSSARFNSFFSLVRGMMEYCEDEDDYDYNLNLARKIKGLEKEKVREIIFLTDAQIHKIRKYLLENKMYRECVYLDLSYDSAARVGEVEQVLKYNLLDNRITNIVTGKRAKKFPLLYHKNTLESLALYLDQRGEDDTPELFVTLRTKCRRASTRKTMYEWCLKFRNMLATYEDEKYMKFTPHSFRHSAIENYKNGTHYMCVELGKPEGFSIEELQALANHESMDTTRSYLKPNQNGLLEGMFNIKIG